MNAMIYAKAIARQRFTPVTALRSLQRTEKMDAQLAQAELMWRVGPAVEAT